MIADRFPDPPPEGFHDEQRPLATEFATAFPGVTGDTRKAIWAAYIAGAREHQKMLDTWSQASGTDPARARAFASLVRAEREVADFVQAVVG